MNGSPHRDRETTVGVCVCGMCMYACIYTAGDCFVDP